MRRSRIIKVLPLVALVFVSGCFFDPDEDKIGKTSPRSETDPCFPGTDAEGVGDPCDGDTDCAGGDADVCLKNPMDPSAQGACSVAECNLGCCPEGFVCCDCSDAGIDLGWTIACVPDEEAAMAEGLCTCG